MSRISAATNDPEESPRQGDRIKSWIISIETGRNDAGLRKEFNFAETETKGHGRTETRRCWTTDNLGAIQQAAEWKNLRSIGLLETERTMNGTTSRERRFIISSRKNLTAKKALEVVRAHWGIENELHWGLDVAFREDDCRVRAGNAAENFAVLRHAALNLLKRAPGKKLGIKTRRLKAGWDHNFLMQVLAAGVPD